MRMRKSSTNLLAGDANCWPQDRRSIAQIRIGPNRFDELNDDVEGWQGVLVTPKCLTKSSLDPIPLDGSLRLSFSDDEPQAGVMCIRQCCMDPEGATAKVHRSLLQDTIELALVSQSIGARQPHLARHIRRRGVGVPWLGAR